MLSRLKEEDFAVLRGPLESGRQSPNSLAFTLVLCVIFQPLLFFLVYVVAADSSNFPFINNIYYIHLIITISLVVLSAIFSIKTLYKKYQKIQYLLVILGSQNIGGISFYLMALFFIGQNVDSESSLLTLAYITLLFGLLTFVVTCIRFYILLKSGAYRKESKRDGLRSKLELDIKSYMPIIITASIGLVFVLQFLVRTFGLADIETTIMMIFCFSLFYTMLFVLPEQLVILYCKYRFDSFNYNKNGKLKPMGRKGA
ncbi:hypothetical protein [Oceanobacillus saliphilus]|uniref:hypothetical protein n=1 Tax=Oceanobacillus saliphilus TaxID=2925834 RepID=UPI00201D5A76|nr:hypothetical protein [Oceanobacillus saliphilus]